MDADSYITQLFSNLPDGELDRVMRGEQECINEAELRSDFFENSFFPLKINSSKVLSISIKSVDSCNNKILHSSCLSVDCQFKENSENSTKTWIPQGFVLLIDDVNVKFTSGIILGAKNVEISRNRVFFESLTFSAFGIKIFDNMKIDIAITENNETGKLKLHSKNEKIELDIANDTIFTLIGLIDKISATVDIELDISEFVLHLPQFSFSSKDFHYESINSLFKIGKLTLKSEKHFYSITGLCYSNDGMSIDGFESDFAELSLPLKTSFDDKEIEIKADSIHINGDFSVVSELMHFVQSDFVLTLALLPQRCNTRKLTFQVKQVSFAGISFQLVAEFNKGFAQFVIVALVIYAEDEVTNTSIPVISNGTIQVVRENIGETVIINAFVNLPELRATIEEVQLLFEKIKKFVVYIIDEHAPMINVNFTQTKLVLCKVANMRKHAIARVSINDFITSFSHNSDVTSAKIPICVSAESWNPVTSFWDSLVEEFDCDISITHENNNLEIIALMKKEIVVNISTIMLQKLKDLLGKAEMCTESIFLSNELSAPLNVSVDASPVFTLMPKEIKEIDATTKSFVRLDLFSTIFNIYAIDSPMFISPQYAVVPDTYKGGKLLRFCSRYSFRNNLPSAIILTMDDTEHMKHNEVNIQTREQLPIPPEFFEAKFVIQLPDSTAETILPFKINALPKRYKVSSSLTFIDCFFSITEDPITMCNVITIDAPLLFENVTPYSVTCSFTIGEQTTAAEAKPYASTSVQMADIISVCDEDMKVDILANVPEFGFSEKTSLQHPSKTTLKFVDGSRMNVEMKVLESGQMKVTIFPSFIFTSHFLHPIFYGTSSEMFPLSNGHGMLTIPDKSSEGSAVDKNVYIAAEEESRCLVQTKGSLRHVRMLPTHFDKLFIPVVVSFQEHNYGVTEIEIGPRMTIQNDLDVTLTFEVENEFSFAIPEHKTSDVPFSSKDFLFKISCEHGTIDNMFLVNPLATVFRFGGAKRRKGIDELYVLLEITTDNLTSHIRFSNATMPAPFVLINEMQGFDVFAQQAERSFPIRIKPNSCSIIPFDAPFSEPVLMVTISGKSQLIQLNRSYPEYVSLPFRVGSDIIFFEFQNVSQRTRALIITRKLPEEISKHLMVSFTLEISRLSVSFFDQSLFEFLLVTCNKVIVACNTETNLERSFTLAVDSVQIDDQQSFSKSGVVFKGTNNGHDPFIRINSHFDKRMRNLLSLEVFAQPSMISINSSFLSDLMCYFKDFECLLELNPNLMKVYSIREINIHPILLKLMFLQMNKRHAHYDKNYEPIGISDCRCNINICSLTAKDSLLSPFALQDMIITHVRRYFNLIYSRLHDVEPTVANSIPFSRFQTNLVVSELYDKTSEETEIVHRLLQLKPIDVFPVLTDFVLTYLDYTDTSSTVLTPSISDQLSPETRNIGQRIKNQRFFCRKCITKLSDDLVSTAILLKKQLYNDKSGDKLLFMCNVGDKKSVVAAITTTQFFLVSTVRMEFMAKVKHEFITVKQVNAQRLSLQIDPLPNGKEGGEILLDFETSFNADKFITVFKSAINQTVWKI